MTIDNRLAVLSLIGCDFSYWSRRTVGDPLATFPDSKAIGGALEPDPIPEELMRSAGLQFNKLSDGRYQIEGWLVADVISNSQTGFGATVLQNADKTEAIVAFTGTNGLTAQGLQGWYTDIALGRTQWTTDIQSALLASIANLVGSDGERGTFNGTLHFTGQSLGGALAQYAIFDLAAFTEARFDASKVTLTTFNSLGSLEALSELGNYSATIPRLSGVKTAHYTIYNDVVHRLGGGYVNGAGNTYQLKFTETVPAYEYLGPDGNMVAIPAREVAFDLVDAHRIESGFYRGFARSGGDFRSAATYTPKLISAEAARSVADGFANLLNDRDHSAAESVARIVAGISASIAINPSASAEIASELLKSARLSARTGQASTFYSMLEFAVPRGLEGLDGQPLIRTYLMAVATFALGTAAGMDASEEVGESATAFTAYLRSAIEEARRFSPVDVVNYDFATDLIDDAGLLRQQTKAAAALAVATGTMPGFSDQLNASLLADQANALQAMKSVNWVKDLLRYVTAKIHETRTAAGDSAEQVQEAVGEALAEAAKGIYAVGSRLLNGTAQSVVALDALATALTGALGGIFKAAANAYEDFTAKYSDALSAWVTGLSRASLEGLRRGFEVGLNVVRTEVLSAVGMSSAAAVTRSAELHASLAPLVVAGQAVVVRRGREMNPFDQSLVDPNEGPISLEGLMEGAVEPLTAYLPYEATAAGQRIRFRLGGTAAAKLSVLSNGVSVLDADGSFALTAEQGQREVTFSIAALKDIDADDTLTLSAQLVSVVDGAEVATHLEDEELSLTLSAVVEQAPQGGREIHGDWAAKVYVDEVTGEPYVQWDDLGNIEREPGTVSMGDVEIDQVLGGSSGAERVFTGDYDERAYTYGGNDVIFGSGVSGNILLSGSGDDWVEGRGNTTAVDPEQRSFVYQGREVSLGDDVILGGGGNDTLYGDAEATQEQLNDPTVATTALPGDWINGGTGDDRLYGTAGHDVLLGGTGKDLLQGGAGKDVLLGDENFGLAISGNYWRVMHPFFTDQTFSGFELGLFPVYNYAPLVANPGDIDPNAQDPYVTYYKDGGDDVLIGGTGRDVLIGQFGNDTLYGGEDDDVLAGWEGNDQVLGGEGDDLMAGDFGRYEQPLQRLLNAPNVGIPGLVGAPTFDSATVDQAGNDYLDAGAGADTVFGEGGKDAIMGRSGDDTLFGDALYLPDGLHGDDTIDGGEGSDAIHGNGGNDRIFGGADNDAIEGGAGDDVADGGAGDDTIRGNEGNDALKGADGLDRIEGGDGNDTLHGGAGNDELAGGEGNDRSYGESGADSLDGDAGDDQLYGGSGEDVLSGGDGNDVIDGGAGIDIARGGAGDDTYVMAFGYGRDIVEDTQGRNRLSFAPGISAADLSAEIESSTLAATITFSGIGDAVAFDAGEARIDGIDFAGGTSWGRREFLGFMPALLAQGTAGSDALAGIEQLRNTLRGFDGDDALTGSGNDDALEGGDGADAMDGGGGSDRYFFTGQESGVDQLVDSGVSSRAYLEWYYSGRGIADWEERGVHGGRYRAEGGGEVGDFLEYFDTYEAAIEQYPSAAITYVEPLADLAPPVSRNDATGLAELVEAGVLDTDTVEFGEGVALADLALTFTVDGASAEAHPGQPRHGGGTLSVRWGNGGFDLVVPDVAYGSTGPDLFTGGDPDADGSTAWRGYRLGEGIEKLVFADGTTYALEDVLREAALALAQQGSEFGDELIALDGFPNALYGNGGDDLLSGGDGDDLLAGGAGQDFLSGGAGDDRYAFDVGDGEDWITENREDGADGFDTLAFGPGILPGEVVLSQEVGGLRIALPSAEAVTLGGWFDEPGGTVERIEFADGTTWDAAAVEARLPDPTEATEGDEELLGRTGDDVIEGLAGSDELYGFAGNDILRGGDGADFLGDWRGNNLLDAGTGDDRIYGDIGSNFAIGGGGDDWIDHFGSGVVAFNPGDGNDTVYVANALALSLGGGITPGDLALSADGEDLILATGGTDSIRLTRRYAEDPSAWPQIALQLFGSVHRYDFNAVIGDFRAAVGADPALERFPLAASLAAHETDVSDAAALGGEIAWQYASAGNLDAMAEDEIRALLGGPGFGVEAQPISPRPRNAPPELASPIPDLAAQEDAAFAYTIEPGAFTDPDAGDALALSATRADGTALPEWLAFDAPTWTFNGRPAQADVGEVDIRVTATDPKGEQTSDVFRLTVLNVNDAPVEALPLGGRSFEAGSAFSFTIPAATFLDEDGEPLALGAALFGGGALPQWLSFDASSGTFSGAPQLSHLGVSHVEVIATDAGGAAASSDFGLVVRAPAGAEVTGSSGDDVLYGGTGDETLTAKGGSDYLFGDAGNDLLKGGRGHDVLQGGAGSDVLRGGAGQNVLDGGAGDDRLYGGRGSSFLIGGAGNDTLRVGRGNDVIGFNAGDGIDTVYGGRDGGNTLSFGGGIGYDDLSLSRTGKDLVVSAGENDKVILKNWYAGNRSVANLQILLDASAEFDATSQDPLYNRKVQRFDFLAMVDAYDSARRETPGLSSWQITNALLQFHLSASDDFAIGGDLAYWYGRNRTLAGIGLSAAQQIIGAPNFGSDAQSLRPFDGLQEGFAKLS